MSLIVDTMHEIGVTRVSRWVFNCYIIHAGDDGPVVVDAGMPSAPDDLAPILRELPGPLSTIVATHGHSDHVGGAAGLVRRYGASLYLPTRTLSYLDGVRPRTPSPRSAARIAPVLRDQPFDAMAVAGVALGALRAGYGTPRGMVWSGPRPAGGLDDGQPVPGASAWTVMHAPGHTDDSVVFWNATTATLLSGDAVISARGQAWHTAELVDTADGARTAEQLERLPVEHLLPGHGRPVHAASVWADQRR